MTDPAQRRYVDTSIRIRTTTERNITYDDYNGLTHSHHTLIVDDPVENDHGIEVATMDSFTIDPTVEPDWFITMDDYSQELCHIAELLLYRHPYASIIATCQADASERGAANGRFVVLSSLWTHPPHRGNGYGLSLLHEVIRTSLRAATFVIGQLDDPNATVGDEQQRSNPLAELVSQRTRARHLEADVLMLP